MQIMRSHIIDLTTIKGRGEFKCPGCGVEISPDDKKETVYAILEPVMKGNSLEELVLQCKMCGSLIRVIGFDILSMSK